MIPFPPQAALRGGKGADATPFALVLSLALAFVVAPGLAPRAAEPPRATPSPAQSLPLAPDDDPFCSTSNLVVSAADLAQAAPQTRRMAELLARLAAAAPVEPIACLAHRRVPELRRQLTAATNVRAEIRLRWELGQTLVQVGRASDGLRELRHVEQALPDLGGSLDDITPASLRHRQAVAALRLGEDENCVVGSTSESCLLPFGPAGYHRRPRGSRLAFDTLTRQLQVSPGDLRARWLLNLAAMTLGEYPASVPADQLIPPRAFASEYPLPKFPEVAAEHGLALDGLAGGCVFDDFDNDGRLDLMASSWELGAQLRYFHNDGQGRFHDATVQAGLAGETGGLNLQQTDYNNDGHLDLWILRGGWLRTAGRFPNSLLRNNGDGTFTDVTEEAGLLGFHPTQTSVWFDYDGDGWLDLFVGNETWDPRDPDPCELFHNNRDGTFTECAAASGLAVARLVKGVACADYDGDRRPDLYLSCLDGPNLLFHNDGPATNTLSTATRWRFGEVSAAAGLAETIYSFPTWFFDYDNDGRDDLFVGGYRIQDVGDIAADYLGLRHRASLTHLYHNEGHGTFRDVSRETHLDHLCLAMGSNFGDLDNDGWLDLYLGTGDPDLATIIPNRMFRNDGGRRFQDVTTAGGFGHLQKGHGIAFADFDNDGDQDVYVVLGGVYPVDHFRNALFLNPGNGNHWLKLALEGRRENRAAIGTRIQVTFRTPRGLRTIHRTVNGGGSFGSSPLRQELGLADATAIVNVTLLWPSTGTRQVLTGFELDRTYRIREGDPTPTVIQLPP